MKTATGRIMFFILMLCLLNKGMAQLIFPDGPIKKINTTLPVLYDETKIPFIAKNNKVTNLSWRLLYDSIPTSWEVMACMNGTCIGGVPPSGLFENLMALPDTIGFLKYHFNFNDIPGSARIAYIINNHLLFNDPGDTAIFDITYTTNNSISNLSNHEICKVSPNPAASQWNIAFASSSEMASYSLINLEGQTIQEANCDSFNYHFNIQIANQDLPEGIYFLYINNGTKQYRLKLVKE